MLPYLQLQLGYLALSGLLSGLAFFVAGILAPSAMFFRHIVALGGVAFASVVLNPVAGIFTAGESLTNGFMVIAWVFYACVIWCPLLSLGLAARKKTDEPRRQRAFTVAFSIASILVGVDALFIEPNRMQERTDTIAFEDWPTGSDPVRIVHISDLQTVGTCERERLAADAINALEPDLIVVTGDYIAGPFWDTGPAVEAARAFLSSLSAKHGIVVVPGHAERERDRREVFDGLGLTYLSNQEWQLELSGGRTLSFWGIPAHAERVSFKGLRRAKSGNEVRVLVSHVPDESRRIGEFDVDLHLAGHTHGGQIVVPGFGPPITLSRLPRKFARGLHRFGDHWLNVSAGIGMEGNHAPRIRLFCPPEISLLILEGAGEEVQR